MAGFHRLSVPRASRQNTPQGQAFVLHRIPGRNIASVRFMPSTAPIRHMPGLLASPGIESYRVVAILIIVSFHTNLIARLHFSSGAGWLPRGNAALSIVLDLRPLFLFDGGILLWVTVDARQPPSLLRRSLSLADAPLCPIWVAVCSIIGPNWITNVYTQGLWHYHFSGGLPTLDMLVQSMSRCFCPRPPIFHLWFCRR